MDEEKKNKEEEKPPVDLKSIEGVEVFAVGTWNGDEYTESDLDEMVKAFEENKETLKPFLKLGHDDGQKLVQSDGFPAAGWVSNLKRVGEKLVADFENIPSKIYELIERGAYKKVSSEIYWNIKLKDKVYNKFLSAVSLLGADLPAVSSLSDILSLYSIEKKTDIAQTNESAILKHYEFPSRGAKDMELEKKVEELTKELEAKQAEIKKFSQDQETKENEIKTLTEKVEKFSQDLAQEAAKRQDAELERFIDSLETVTPAMRPYVKELLGETKKEYSIKEKTYTKAQLLEEVLKLHSESSVNLKEGSEEGEAKDDAAAVEAKIEKYMSEHKCSYTTAYKEVMRGAN